jgi:hypothetical protein
MGKYIFTLWMLVINLLSACVHNVETPPSTAPLIPTVENSPQPSTSWEIKFNLSGGLRGYQRVIRLSHLGELIVVDEKTNQQVSVQLAQEEMNKFNQLLVGFEQLQSDKQPPSCADCMVYELDVQIDGRNFHAVFNDLNLNETSVKLLINELVKLQEEALNK